VQAKAIGVSYRADSKPASTAVRFVARRSESDDETVRITRWDFPPGAVIGWHEHGWPYFVVMITEGPWSSGTSVTVVPSWIRRVPSVIITTK
jgi:quercetin dioxygenase-like cupin family protein